MTEATTPTPADAKPTGGLAAMDFLRTLDGYEETAIEDHFRRDVDELPYGRQLRALVFVMRIRSGMTPMDAYRAVMALQVAAVFEEFPDLARPKAADPEPDTEPFVSASQVEDEARAALDACTDDEGCAAQLHLSTCPER